MSSFGMGPGVGISHISTRGLSPWAAQLGRCPDQLRDHATVRAELQRGVDRTNQVVSRAESIRAFVVLDRALSEEHGELTPTMKPRREVVAEHFADEIEGLYGRPESAEQRSAGQPAER